MSDDTPTAGPMYPQQLVTWPAEGSLEFTDVQTGPAGVSVVELPDGVTVEVDHADPGQLVALSAPDDLDPLSLRRWIGRRAASRNLGGRERDDPTAPTLVPKVGRTTVGTGRARRRPDDPAVAFGRLVVAAELLDDTELEPIARLVAGVELLLELDDDPTADLLLPLRSDVRRRVEALALQVDDVDDAEQFEGLSPDSVRRAADVVRTLVGRLAPRSLPLERLSARLDRLGSGVAADMSEAVGEAFAPLDDAVRPDLSTFEPKPRSAAAPPPDDFLRVERLEPALLHVQVSRAADGDWVRVLRNDGLVLLAAAPLIDDGLLRSAELIVPPDTVDDELVVQIVDATDVDHGPRPSDLVRQAVRSGRDAARADRLGRSEDARRRWSTCAALWARAGDDHRTTLALRRAEGSFDHLPVIPLVCDQLTEDRSVSEFS